MNELVHLANLDDPDFASVRVVLTVRPGREEEASKFMSHVRVYGYLQESMLLGAKQLNEV